MHIDDVFDRKSVIIGLFIARFASNKLSVVKKESSGVVEFVFLMENNDAPIGWLTINPVVINKRMKICSADINRNCLIRSALSYGVVPEWFGVTDEISFHVDNAFVPIDFFIDRYDIDDFTIFDDRHYTVMITTREDGLKARFDVDDGVMVARFYTSHDNRIRMMIKHFVHDSELNRMLSIAKRELDKDDYNRQTTRHEVFSPVRAIMFEICRTMYSATKMPLFADLIKEYIGHVQKFIESVKNDLNDLILEKRKTNRLRKEGILPKLVVQDRDGQMRVILIDGFTSPPLITIHVINENVAAVMRALVNVKNNSRSKYILFYEAMQLYEDTRAIAIQKRSRAVEHEILRNDMNVPELVATVKCGRRNARFVIKNTEDEKYKVEAVNDIVNCVIAVNRNSRTIIHVRKTAAFEMKNKSRAKTIKNKTELIEYVDGNVVKITIRKMQPSVIVAFVNIKIKVQNAKKNGIKSIIDKGINDAINKIADNTGINRKTMLEIFTMRQWV